MLGGRQGPKVVEMWCVECGGDGGWWWWYCVRTGNEKTVFIYYSICWWNWSYISKCGNPLDQGIDWEILVFLSESNIIVISGKGGSYVFQPFDGLKHLLGLFPGVSSSGSWWREESSSGTLSGDIILDLYVLLMGVLVVVSIIVVISVHYFSDWSCKLLTQIHHARA